MAVPQPSARIRRETVRRELLPSARSVRSACEGKMARPDGAAMQASPGTRQLRPPRFGKYARQPAFANSQSAAICAIARAPVGSALSSILKRGEWFESAFAHSASGVTPRNTKSPGTLRA